MFSTIVMNNTTRPTMKKPPQALKSRRLKMAYMLSAPKVPSVIRAA